MDSIEKKPGFRRFPSFQIQAITLILLAGFVPAKLAAAEYEITPSNYQQVLPNRTIVAYMGLNCDMGSYAASLFKQSMYDLKGPDLGTININQSSFLRSELPIDLGSIIIIKNGEVIASSEEVKNWLDIAGYTGKRRWVSSTLQKHGITFSGLTLDGPDRMQPDAGPAGGVDLISGLLALYRFNGDLKEETGKNIHLRIDSPVFQIMDDALHGNGFRSPAVETEDPVSFCNGVPALDIGERAATATAAARAFGAAALEDILDIGRAAALFAIATRRQPRIARAPGLVALGPIRPVAIVR